MSRDHGLRVVREESIVPVGARFDPRRLRRTPVRALRGGADGVAVRFSFGDGALGVAVLAAGACNDDDVAWALDRARGISAVDDDPDPFLRAVAEHPLLGRLSRQYDARLTRAPTLFESLAHAIIGQLVTTAEASASVARLWGIAGELVAGTDLRAAPTPAAVRRVPMWKMHAIGVGSRRATTLNECAKRGAAIERLRDEAPEVALEKLMTLRGVGPWTANLAVGGGMGWSDAVPVGDLHAPRIITQALLGEAGGDAEMLAALEPFRPHRARAAKLLVRTAVRDGPRPKVDRHRREPWRY